MGNNRADMQDDTLPKVERSQVGNQCVVCEQQRDYRLIPIGFLDDDFDIEKGGVCREIYPRAYSVFGQEMRCVDFYNYTLLEKQRKLERSKWPSGHAPTETELLTTAVKELTQELATWRTKAKKPPKTHTKSAQQRPPKRERIYSMYDFEIREQTLAAKRHKAHARDATWRTQNEGSGTIGIMWYCNTCDFMMVFPKNMPPIKAKV